ncbi:MAG: 50S ribosomal protein L18 [Candidatus Pacearchaeota archaeon]
MKIVPKKRRREGVTDYKQRLNLLKSKRPRIVIRKTNKYIIIQEIESKESKDFVLTTISSKNLIGEGFPEKFSGSLKSLPAAYLTGILMAKKMKNKNVVVDIGLYKNHYGGRLYAVVKGLIDGGIKIKADEKIFPSKERLEGEHLKEEVKKEFSKLKEKLAKK